MRARRIYSDPAKQRNHTAEFEALRRLVFADGGSAQVREILDKHPGKALDP